jgi:nucleoside phosphorylase
MDIAILTPIDVEYNAVRRHLENIEEDRNAKGLYEIGSFDTKLGNLSIVLQQTGARNSSIALATERIIELYNPKIIFLVGVAGGVKDVAIGSIVVGTKTYGYESGKETEDGFKARPEVYTFTKILQDIALSVSRKGIWLRRTGKGKIDAECVFGAIASGDKVIATQKTNLFNFLKDTYNDTAAIDMEAVGFAEVFTRHTTIKYLCIRGISDLLDNKSKSDSAGGQQLASANVAAFTFELISQLTKDDLGGDSSSKSTGKTTSPNSPQIINNKEAIGNQFNIQHHTGDIVIHK